MKTKTFTDYLSPEIEIVTVSTEGVLCQSDGFGIQNMDIKQGGIGTDWDWE